MVQVLLGVIRGCVAVMPITGTQPLVTPNNTCTTLLPLNRHNAYIKTPAPDTPDWKTYEADTSQTPQHPFTHNIRKKHTNFPTRFNTQKELHG